MSSHVRTPGAEGTHKYRKPGVANKHTCGMIAQDDGGEDILRLGVMLVYNCQKVWALPMSGRPILADLLPTTPRSARREVPGHRPHHLPKGPRTLPALARPAVLRKARCHACRKTRRLVEHEPWRKDEAGGPDRL